MSKILITGGTGFVNSFLAATLLKMGEHVFFLARSSAYCNAAQRIKKALDLTGLIDACDTNYTVIEADLLKEGLGISAENLMRLKREGIDEIIHGAGSVNFSKENTDSIFNANYHGTKKMAALAEILEIKCFHYISTAYAAANDNIFDHIQGKQISNRSNFNNHYEYSKSLAASLIKDWGKAKNKPVIIYEPSIITGHSVTGKAFNFSAFYNCLHTYSFLQNKITKKGASGINIQIPGHNEAYIDLITIDYFIEIFKLIREFGNCGSYKIINETPPVYRELQAMCLRYYDLSNVNISNSSLAHAEFNGEPDKPLSSFLQRSMSAYLPYISRSFNFDMSCVKQLLGSKYKPHFKIDQPHINLFASYADENNFQLSA